MIMKKFYLKFRIALMTFALGLVSVRLLHNLQSADDNLENETKNATIVVAVPMFPKFMQSSHACGLDGYSDLYFSDGGVKLTEGYIGCKEPKNRDIIKRDKIRVISRVKTIDSY